MAAAVTAAVATEMMMPRRRQGVFVEEISQWTPYQPVCLEIPPHLSVSILFSLALNGIPPPQHTTPFVPPCHRHNSPAPVYTRTGSHFQLRSCTPPQLSCILPRPFPIHPLHVHSFCVTPSRHAPHPTITPSTLLHLLPFETNMIVLVLVQEILLVHLPPDCRPPRHAEIGSSVCCLPRRKTGRGSEKEREEKKGSEHCKRKRGHSAQVTMSVRVTAASIVMSGRDWGTGQHEPLLPYLHKVHVATHCCFTPWINLSPGNKNNASPGHLHSDPLHRNKCTCAGRLASKERDIFGLTRAATRALPAALPPTLRYSCCM
ncbi:hypothetical protein O3P69_013186 [Scylla paramamosain]|uniref:Uncharacterized protein n=1 Tax=Scylla paramamosain TaxID=85552 RepID=A0AAW0TZR9_SCYPA